MSVERRAIGEWALLPPAKRKFGPHVLPILYGDRLIRRIDRRTLFDRISGELRVKAVYAEEQVNPLTGASDARATSELAAWLGATRLSVAKVPKVWQQAFTAIT